MPLSSRLTLSLLAALFAILAGCGDTGTRPAAEYRALTGQWAVVNVDVDGVSYTVETRERYDTLTFAFSDGDTRRYAIEAVRDGQPERIAEGEVEVVDSGRIALATGLSQSVLLTFDMTSSRRAVLVVPSFRTSGSEALMQALLPRQSWVESQRVELVLELQSP